MSDIYDDDSFKKTTRQVGRQDQFVIQKNITPQVERTKRWTPNTHNRTKLEHNQPDQNRTKTRFKQVWFRSGLGRIWV